MGILGIEVFFHALVFHLLCGKYQTAIVFYGTLSVAIIVVKWQHDAYVYRHNSESCCYAEKQ